jgi:hypothetical protein
VQLSELSDGRARGIRTAEFRTGSGLSFTVLLDRGMDISTTSYKGQPIAWRSSTGDVSPYYYEKEGEGWLRGFAGGLVVTAGLTYAGAPTVDEGKELGLHGRAANLAASNILADGEWIGDDYVMWVQGKTRETVVFGENIELSRRISAKLGESRLTIHDKVTNLGHARSEHMILYHCNMGFPIVDAGSRLVADVSSMTPRDAQSEAELAAYAQFCEPVPGWEGKVYYLDLKEDADGMAKAALVNGSFGVYMKFPKKELPLFSLWKNMAPGDYVVGMEPSNCHVEGRDKDRACGVLQYLEPGESREYHLEIGILASPEDMASL